MPLSRDRCICVRKVEYSETSQILTLFAREHGILQVIAKGAHRRTKAGQSKFDGGADLLDVGDAVFTFEPSRDLNTLTEWSLREGNLPLRLSLRGMYLGLYAAEMITALIHEHDPLPDLYQHFEASLGDLGGDKREETFLAFQLDLLHQTGNLDDPGTCVACGSSVIEAPVAWFSPTQGGSLCRNCEGAVADRARFDPKLLSLAQQVLGLPRNEDGTAVGLPSLIRQQTDPLNRLFAWHVSHILGKRMRMTAYVLSSLKRDRRSNSQ